jgi:nitroimidazol reductase NimA-like FMN-containing flavoprotein (pyridoxamine 5'-phosphate oxidase superfamily)
MKLIDDHSGLEILDEDACRRLLSASELGRLALSVHGSPEIFPVNYRLDGNAIIMRSAGGSKVQAVGHTLGAFEIDGIDRINRTGWSVVVKGRLEELQKYDGAAWLRANALDIDPWAGGDRPHILCLHMERITGRRVGDA